MSIGKWIRNLFGKPKDEPEPAPELDPMVDEQPPELEGLGEPDDLTLDDLGVESADLPDIEPMPMVELPGPVEYQPAELNAAPDITAPEVAARLDEYIHSSEMLPETVVSEPSWFRAVIVDTPIASGVKTPNNTPIQWYYFAQRARPTSIVYGAASWETYGDKFITTNDAEVLTTATTLGSGLPTSELDYDADGVDEFYPIPVPAGRPVWVRQTTVGLQIRYSIDVPLEIGGGC